MSPPSPKASRSKCCASPPDQQIRRGARSCAPDYVLVKPGRTGKHEAAIWKYRLCRYPSEREQRVQHKQRFTASVWREGEWYVAQCLEVDAASQGETEDEALANLREALANLREALANLREALELYFEPPTPTVAPHVRTLEAEIGAA